MYGAGLRLSELVGLDIKHLDLESGEVWVMGKGSKRAPPADWSQRRGVD